MNFEKRMLKNFYPVLKKYIGMPFNYLEIGVFRGTTFNWVLNNIATNEDSRLIGIDPWDQSFFSSHDVKNPCDWNELLNKIAKIKDLSYGKADFIRGRSIDVLRSGDFSDNYFDAVYIDGNHTTQDVLIDHVLTYPLLKIGGVMIFDDYNQIPVKIAVDTILTGLNGKYKSLFINRQLGITKL